MVDTIKTTMLEAEKLAIKIKKKAKRNDLDFSVQVSLSSADPKTIYFSAQITPMAEGLAPQTFITKSGEELLERMKAVYEGKMSPDQVERTYHESQITHAERTIKFHKESIDALDNFPEEEIEELVKDTSNDKKGEKE